MAAIQENNPDVADLLLAVQRQVHLAIATPTKKLIKFEPIEVANCKMFTWYTPAVHERIDFSGVKR
jgi:hypothetical protein